ncbi:MAG: sulfatase [Planctomycetota bacterium]
MSAYLATDAPVTDTPRPNVIWFFGDQHRAQATGYSGDPNLHTPSLDRLAATGLEVTQAVGGCPLCCPFRGSLLSGRYPHEAVPGHEVPLPEGMTTVAGPFNEAGYRTAYLGKWHLDGGGRREGRQKGRLALGTVTSERRGGFEHWLGFENNESQYETWLHGHDETGEPVDHFRLPGYGTDAITDLAIDYIGRRGTVGGDGDPFFLAVSVQSPHDPYIAPRQWMGRHTPGGVTLRPNVPDIPRVVRQARTELAGYYAMIENLDHNLGRLRDALDQAGLADHTHLVFFSDHGDMHGSHGMFRKTNPYEESLRVPCVIGGCRDRYDGRPSQLDAPLNHVDYAPTSLGLCGIEPPEWMAGFNYAPFRLNDKPFPEPPDSAFCQLVKATGHRDSTDRPWRAVVTRDGWKYACLERQPWLLFDLNEDPCEQANLAHNKRFAAERRRLHDRLAQWIAETGDDFALPTL